MCVCASRKIAVEKVERTFFRDSRSCSGLDSIFKIVCYVEVLLKFLRRFRRLCRLCHLRNFNFPNARHAKNWFRRIVCRVSFHVFFFRFFCFANLRKAEFAFDFGCANPFWFCFSCKWPLCERETVTVTTSRICTNEKGFALTTGYTRCMHRVSATTQLGSVMRNS